jgi:hypothetical protein
VQTITVIDNTAPTISCPATQSQSATNGVSTTLSNYTSMATTSDNCSANGDITVTQSPAIGSTQAVGPVTVTLTAEDECGNSDDCTFTVNITNGSSIAWTSQPASTTIQCDASTATSATGVATASTTCGSGGLSVTFADVTAAGSCANASTITRTWTATDNCSNTETHVQTITVIDDTAPTITCPSNQTIQSVNGTDGDLLDYTSMATVSDNCSSVGNVSITQSPAIGSTHLVGTVTVTLTATDECGNSDNCTFDVVISNTSITWTNEPVNSTIECSDSDLPANTGEATAMTTCGTGGLNITYSDNVVAGSCVNESTITRTWTATDACSNSETYVQTITVEDNTAPTITCPPNQVVYESGNGIASFTSLAVVSDNCSSNGQITVTQSPVAGSTLAGGESHTITLTATDECGNTNSCDFILTLKSSVGIETNNENILTVYPNPTTGIVNINFGNVSNDIAQVSVYNLIGEIVYFHNNVPMTGNHSLDLDRFERGIYYVNITIDGETTLKKVVLM